MFHFPIVNVYLKKGHCEASGVDLIYSPSLLVSISLSSVESDLLSTTQSLVRISYGRGVDLGNKDS
jgi:hypothetical protein